MGFFQEIIGAVDAVIAVVAPELMPALMALQGAISGVSSAIQSSSSEDELANTSMDQAIQLDQTTSQQAAQQATDKDKQQVLQTGVDARQRMAGEAANKQAQIIANDQSIPSGDLDALKADLTSSTSLRGKNTAAIAQAWGISQDQYANTVVNEFSNIRKDVTATLDARRNASTYSVQPPDPMTLNPVLPQLSVDANALPAFTAGSAALAIQDRLRP